MAEQSLTPRLRLENRILIIQASLAIENNTLTLEQVTAVLPNVVPSPAEEDAGCKIGMKGGGLKSSNLPDKHEGPTSR